MVNEDAVEREVRKQKKKNATGDKSRWQMVNEL